MSRLKITTTTAIYIDIEVETGGTTDGINFFYDNGDGVCFGPDEAEQIAAALLRAAKLHREGANVA